MARDLFNQTLAYVDQTTGALKPLNNTQITVYLAGTSTKATIYAARDPNNATQVANPFTTSATGYAEFWVEPGEYDIAVQDLTVPQRTSNRTVGFNSMPAAVGGIPANRVAADAGLPYGALSAVAVRQDIPIGGIIDWWRPNSSVPVPTGFVIADGRQVLAADHEFPGISTNINVPDLRNAFVLGANSANADGATAVAGGDAVTDAPGIGGTGGSQFRNLAHTHDMTHTHTLPAHYHGKGTLSINSSGSHGHGISDPWHSHGHSLGTSGAGSHGHSLSGNVPIYNTTYGGAGSFGIAGGSTTTLHRQALGADGVGDHSHGVTGGINSAGTGISINAASHSHGNADFAGSVGATGGSNGDAAMTTSAISTANTASAQSATQDIRPKYVGLLKIIKVKRS